MREPEEHRPRTRGECADVVRPCPFVSCRHNHAVDVNASGGIVERGPAAESCALDVADAGPHTLEEVGEILGIVRERVRQIEERAVARLGRREEMMALR